MLQPKNSEFRFDALNMRPTDPIHEIGISAPVEAALIHRLFITSWRRSLHQFVSSKAIDLHSSVIE